MIRVLKLIEDEARRRKEDQRVEAERRQRIEVNEARLVATLLPLLPPAEEGAKRTFELGMVRISCVDYFGLSIKVTYQNGQWAISHLMGQNWDAGLEYLLADVPE